MKKLFPIFLAAFFTLAITSTALTVTKSISKPKEVKAAAVVEKKELQNFLHIPKAGVTVAITEKASGYTASFLGDKNFSDQSINHAILDATALVTLQDTLTLEVSEKMTLQYENSIYEYEIYEISNKTTDMQPGENVLTLSTKTLDYHARLIATR